MGRRCVCEEERSARVTRSRVAIKLELKFECGESKQDEVSAMEG